MSNIWKTFVLFLRSLWGARQANSLASNAELIPLAAYLNKTALIQLDLSSKRTFKVRAVNGHLNIASVGLDQSTIHTFLEKIFLTLEAVARVNKLEVGINRQNCYSAEYEVVQFPLYGIPEEDWSVLEARRLVMQNYGEKLAVELVRIFPLGSSKVSYHVDASIGIMNITFTPSLGAIDYFGVRDMPNESSSYTKKAMTDLAVGDTKKNKFSFVQYSKDPETKASTVVIKFDIREELGDE